MKVELHFADSAPADRNMNLFVSFLIVSGHFIKSKAWFTSPYSIQIVCLIRFGELLRLHPGINVIPPITKYTISLLYYLIDLPCFVCHRGKYLPYSQTQKYQSNNEQCQGSCYCLPVLFKFSLPRNL